MISCLALIYVESKVCIKKSKKILLYQGPIEFLSSCIRLLVYICFSVFFCWLLSPNGMILQQHHFVRVPGMHFMLINEDFKERDLNDLHNPYESSSYFGNVTISCIRIRNIKVGNLFFHLNLKQENIVKLILAQRSHRKMMRAII